MTAFWDELQREVSAASQLYHSDNGDMPFLLHVAKIEARATRAVQAIAALPELPQDLAGKIARAIAKAQTPDELAYRLATRSSQLVSDLHSIFHEIASRRVNTRFGDLSDDPEGTLWRLNANGQDAFTDHVTGSTCCATGLCPEGQTIKDHWSTVRELAQYVREPKNWPEK